MNYPRLDAYGQPGITRRPNPPALAHKYSGLTPEQQAAGNTAQTFQALQGVQGNAGMLTPNATGHLDDARLMAGLAGAQQRGAEQSSQQGSPSVTYGAPGKSFGSNQDQRDGLDPNYTPGYGYSSRMNAYGPSRTPDEDWQHKFTTDTEWRQQFPGQPKPGVTVTPQQLAQQKGYGFDENQSDPDSSRINAYA